MLVEPEAKGARTHDSRVSTRAPELDADAIGAVLGAAVDACDDPEAAARAAAPWIAACRAYRDACYAADHVWRALLDRYFPDRGSIATREQVHREWTRWRNMRPLMERHIADPKNRYAPELRLFESFHYMCALLRAYRKGNLRFGSAWQRDSEKNEYCRVLLRPMHHGVKAFALAAVRRSGLQRDEIVAPMRDDPDVVAAAYAAGSVPGVVQGTTSLDLERELTLKAMVKNGLVLSLASDRMRDDRELVLRAVRKHGSALQFASARLRDDKEVVLAAVRRDPNARAYARARLCVDPEVLAAAAGLPYP